MCLFFALFNGCSTVKLLHILSKFGGYQDHSILAYFGINKSTIAYFIEIWRIPRPFHFGIFLHIFAYTNQ